MGNFLMQKDYLIFIYRKEDKEKYDSAIKALTRSKIKSNWDRVQGVMICEDCRIPSIYHGTDYAIIMERDDGGGTYTINYE